MIRQIAPLAVLGCVVGLAGLPAGCVRRTMTIHSEPDGALVFLNDEEVGRTPVTVPFTWYGDYDVVLRKEGYQTLKTHAPVRAPWYQLPVFDFVAEVLVPWEIHDQHELPLYALEPQQTPTRAELIDRARDFRDRALLTAE